MLLCYPPSVPETDARSDEDLVALCNQGDEGAFEALYRRHRDWVVRLAWRATRNDEDASALAIPVGTVKSRIHHALAALRSDPRAQEFLRG